MKKFSVLFVCTGNICRSPTADGVLRKLVSSAQLDGTVEVDSAGTQGYHVGQAPDQRAQQHAQRRGYDLSGLRARQVGPEDFHRHDLILAMDRSHFAVLNRLCPAEHKSKVRLFLEYAQGASVGEVPDPYYGGAEGFEHVLDLVEDACAGILDEIRALLQPSAIPELAGR
ncbi:protein-tyrosine phosphatase [Formivibrio citricus]|uniref:protein-tyrosine-phosphatase n=1 Tax=Formivibrio citricus TaxID=83765 RepID=A0A1I4X7C6_9NEIS|nr:low molecular weight protein-tyrosine-phosphatase [Formivibrio citricus]SFN21908.1 protein-tyrosine phosphatase [Formivibrio citricus]